MNTFWFTDNYVTKTSMHDFNLFIVHSWLIPFWIENFVVVRLRCEPGL